MKSYIIFSFLTLLFLTSCTKEDDDIKSGKGTVNFRFHLTYDGQPMEMFKEYAYPGTGDKFRMSKVSFFLADLNLTANGGNILLKDIDYLNLTAAHTAPVSANGLEYRVENVLSGKYNGFSFGIGVPPALNQKIPPDFPAGNVLSGTAEYWSAWKSYIFFRPEGKIGLNNSNTIDTNFALHIGGNEGYRVFNVSGPVEVTNDKVSNVDIYIDMKKFFSGNSVFNIRETQQIHSLSQMPLIKILADNLAGAVTVK